MKTSHKTLLVILTILNTVVLLGQIYPEGAPPFARIVNIIFLIASLIFFITSIKRQKETKSPNR